MSMSAPIAPDVEHLLAFWFSDEVRTRWFASTPAFDAQVRARFETLWRRAADGDLLGWEESPRGALALVILLDQLPLNMYRGEAQSFVTEALSREVAARAIARGFDQRLSADQQAFLFMPFMHSEVLADQERAVALYQAAGLENNLKWACHHRDLVRRFGRFPHRNKILGRTSTAEELDYLQSQDAFHG